MGHGGLYWVWGRAACRSGKGYPGRASDCRCDGKCHRASRESGREDPAALEPDTQHGNFASGGDYSLLQGRRRAAYGIGPLFGRLHGKKKRCLEHGGDWFWETRNLWDQGKGSERGIWISPGPGLWRSCDFPMEGKMVFYRNQRQSRRYRTLRESGWSCGRPLWGGDHGASDPWRGRGEGFCSDLLGAGVPCDRRGALYPVRYWRKGVGSSVLAHEAEKGRRHHEGLRLGGAGSGKEKGRRLACTGRNHAGYDVSEGRGEFLYGLVLPQGNRHGGGYGFHALYRHGGWE